MSKIMKTISQKVRHVCRVASRCVTLRHIRHVASRCVTLRHVASRCVTLRHVASRCVTLRHVAPRFVTLRHVASHSSRLSYCFTFATARRVTVRHFASRSRPLENARLVGGDHVLDVDESVRAPALLQHLERLLGSI
jgi:hypothetical protein